MLGESNMIMTIAQAKAQGLTKLVKQLERDKERREFLKMKPLDEVKVEMEVEDLKQDLEEFDDLF
jgi:hypothetical protein|tara:strand:- start:588 stop:782 length:195 start_codon:yes stop_codon:yes gene_type:complete